MSDTTTTHQLANYDAARAHLAAAATVDEVKTIHDKWAGLKVYARQARDKQLLVDATRIRMRARRRLAELLQERRAAGLLAKGTRGQLAGGGKTPRQSDAESFEQMGIDKETAKATRKIGKMSAEEFEAEVERAGRLAAAVIDGPGAVIRESRAEVLAQKAERRANIERDLADKIRALPGARFGVIYADPPWDFSVRAESGLNMHARNHYPTMTLDEIKALDIDKIAATDCVLWLWATGAMMLEALEVMKAWGFTYKSQYIWAKDKFGTGYWARSKHELLLIGVRGNVPAPSQEFLQPSIIPAPVGRHSEKPEDFAELIELYYPTLPKIELFRRGPARKGWAAWGAEAEEASAVA
jgi:N6-adenosine-specific RNA methylase IME4